MSDATKVDKPERPEHKPSRGFHWFSMVVIPLAVAVVSILGTYGFTVYAGRLRVMKYSVRSSAAVFQKPDIRGRQIKVLFDDKRIDNLSSVTIQIYNTTDQDFEDVPVTITLKNPDGSKPVLLYSKCDVPVDPAPQTQARTEPNQVVLPYRIRIANRSPKPLLTADLFVEGGIAPDVLVGIQKKGVDVNHVEVGTGDGFAAGLWAIILGCISGLIIIPIFEHYLHWWKRWLRSRPHRL